MSELVDTRIEGEYERGGYLRGCGIPVALLFVSLACVCLDMSYSRLSLRDRFGGDVPSGVAPDGFGAHTGLLKASAPLGDELLRPGPYVHLQRKVEVYGWVQTSTEESGPIDNVGDRKITTTYHYEQRWTDRLQSSNDFNVPRGHENPPPSRLKDDVLWARGAALGKWPLPVAAVDVGDGRKLQPKANQLLLGARLSDGYVYRGKGSSLLPQGGDERVVYRGLRVGDEATFFGRVDPAGGLGPMPKETPSCMLRLGPPEQAAKSARRDLATGAWKSFVFACLLTWAGLSGAMVAWLMWLQRSDFRSIRKAARFVVAGVAGAASLLLMSAAAFAIQFDTPIEMVWLSLVFVTLVGLFAFRHLARRGNEIVDNSFWWGLLLGSD